MLRWSCVPLPTPNFPQGPRNGRRAETKSPLPPLFYRGSAKSSPVPGDWSGKTKGLQQTRAWPTLASSLAPRVTRAEQGSSTDRGAEGTARGPAAPVLTPVPLQVSPHQLENRCSGKTGDRGRGSRLGSPHPCWVPEVLLAPAGSQAWPPTALLPG